MRSIWNRKVKQDRIPVDDKYRFLIETATDAIYLLDQHGNVVDTNKSAENMLGLSRKALLSSTISDIDPNFSRSQFLEFWKKIPFNDRKVFSTSHRKKDGSVVPVEVSGKKFMYNGETYFYGIARDITARILAEKKLDDQAQVFQFLSNSATEMLQLPDLNSIYRYICHTLHQRYPKSVILFVSVDEKSMISRFVEMVGVEATLMKKLIDVVGFDLTKKVYRIVPGHYAIWKTGRFHAFHGGMSEFVAGEFPAIGARAAQQLFNIHEIYTVGINRGNDLLSAVHVLARDKKMVVEHDFVESFVKQAGIIIQRKLLENELRFQSTILDQIHDSVTVTDLDGVITYVNHAEEKLSKRSAHELIGQKVTIYGENPEASFSQQHIIESTLKLGSWRGEMINYTPDGKEMILDVRTQCIAGEDGKPVAMVGVATDITQQKNTEKELIKAKELAEESNRLKTAFLANISHEVRTPMNGILGFVDLMSESITSDHKRQDYLRIIHQSGQRLLDTIDDILAASRLETGVVEVHMELTDLKELIYNQYEFFRVQAKAKGLSMVLDPACFETSFMIMADVPKLNSVFSNLLKNSIKFTESGHIRLGYTVMEHHVQFYIEDTGIGIAEDQQEAVFKRFVQSDLRINRSYEGAGLGLSIAKAYVELMGGTIWMKSQPGVGTTLFFTLPKKPHS